MYNVSKRTEIVRDLFPKEIELLEEIKRKNMWKKHADERHLHLTALQDGVSFHIQMLTDQLKILKERNNAKLCEDFTNLLVSYCEPYKLGRAYIHKLSPGQCIKKHSDAYMKYSVHIHKRMQMYLNIPSGSILELDDEKKNIEEYKFKYVDFAWYNYHYYYNGGNEDWVFCVFDMLKQTAPVTE